MALEEKRGSSAQKFLDQKFGPFLLGALGALLWVKKRLFTVRSQQEKPLLICFGAIGDLVVLTTAAKRKYSANQLHLACSKLNLPCAKLYSDFYAGIEVVDLKLPWSILGICRRFGISKIYDSTQWANIGPVQVGIARLFHSGLTAVGFKTASPIRSMVYDKVIVHGRDIHEAANFVNLLAEEAVVSSNNQLPGYFPDLYQNKLANRTGKILFHMWPSGNRSYLKAWPEGYWEALVQQCVALGYTIYLSGAPTDQAKTEALVAKLGLSQVVSLAGVHNLKDLADFVAREIEFAVSVNTGILHLVVAAGVPVIGLHGAVNPVRWGPLGGQSISLLPESGRSAYLHYGFEYPEDDSEAYVLDKLSVSQVLGAINELRSRAS